MSAGPRDLQTVQQELQDLQEQLNAAEEVVEAAENAWQQNKDDEVLKRRYERLLKKVERLVETEKQLREKEILLIQQRAQPGHFAGGPSTAGHSAEYRELLLRLEDLQTTTKDLQTTTKDLQTTTKDLQTTTKDLQTTTTQALSRTAVILKPALRYTLSNKGGSIRSPQEQAAFRAALIERYSLHSQQKKDYRICMVTGSELPSGALIAGHIVSVSKFEHASADISLQDPWDVRNGIFWCGALEKAYEDSRVMILWDEGNNNFRTWVLDSQLLDVPLAAGWVPDGEKSSRVQISHRSHYPSITWRSLHGQLMRYQFKNRVHPSRHAFLWHASLAYDVATKRRRVPKDVPDIEAMRTTQVSPAAQTKVMGWLCSLHQSGLPVSAESDTVAASTSQEEGDQKLFAESHTHSVPTDNTQPACTPTDNCVAAAVRQPSAKDFANSDAVRALNGTAARAGLEEDVQAASTCVSTAPVPDFVPPATGMVAAKQEDQGAGGGLRVPVLRQEACGAGNQPAGTTDSQGNVSQTPTAVLPSGQLAYPALSKSARKRARQRERKKSAVAAAAAQQGP